MNSFLQLAQMEMREFEEERLTAVRQRVESRLRAQALIGDVISLFFPLAGDTISVLFGGEAIADDDDNLQRIPPGRRLPNGDATPPLGPGPMTDDDDFIR